MIRSGPFHPDLRRAARLLPGAVVSRRTLPLLRFGVRALGVWRPRDVTVTRVSPHVQVRVHRPENPTPGPAPALLWLHGGGYVMGSAQQDDGTCRRFARELGVVVVAVDYRLAPEHPHPAALDDAVAALTWLTQQPGVDAARIAVGGASAGAGLAAALALAVRGTDLAPVFQLLVYPMLDDRTTARLDVDTAHLRAWNTTSNALGWRSYLGGDPGAAGVPGLAAPAREDDLSGLPPAWVGVGTLDLFHDEDVAYAQRLTAAGVPCALEVVPGAFHGFDVLAPRADVSRDFVAAQTEALRAALLP